MWAPESVTFNLESTRRLWVEDTPFSLGLGISVITSLAKQVFIGINLPGIKLN